MTQPPKQLEGEVLSGRYAVEKRLGSGSMGDVYLAEHILMKKKLALKVLHPEFVNNDEAVKRFQREAQAAGHIDHHNVCVATDFGQTEDGTFFLVMEYLEGLSLGEVIASGPLGPRASAHIARQIASGLVRAHALDIVHRDLKPDNIMIVEREEDSRFVKIMDFGVARVEIGEVEKLTKAGVTYGTPAYMSPEQARGGNVDGRSDLYALGVILFEMLTGAVPFFGSSIAVVMSAHAEKPVPNMREVAPDAEIPDVLEQITLKLLAKNPDERYQSAEELEEDLRAFELGGAVEEAETLEPIARQPEIVPTDEAVAARASAATRKEYSVLSTGGHATVPSSEHSEDVVEDIESTVGVSVGSASTGERLVRKVVEKSDAVAKVSLLEKGRQVWGPMPLFAKVGVGAGLVGVALLPVLVALALFAGDGRAVEDSDPIFGEPETLADEREAFAGQDEFAAAVATLESERDVKSAMETFEAATVEDPENPHAHYFLGRARMKRGALASATEAFARAGELDPRYFEDPELLDAVYEEFSPEDGEGKEAVRSFIAESLVESEIGRERLAAEAAEGDNYKIRHTARRILEETGAKEKLPRWRQVTVELRSTDNCGALKKGVEELGEIGNPAGLPAVERIHRLPRSGCGFLKRGDCYECLRGTVRGVKKKLAEAEEKAGESIDAGGTIDAN